MPAKHLYRSSEVGTFSHIYNKGVENRIIFVDQEDYEIFISYLKDYLSPLGDPESKKKTFTVNGRTFKGTPHQPKNYYEKVELIAYRLKPDHFHLLLHQKTAGSVEKLLRSLGTRYSMYFNKKYRRAGALFQGPYKSAHIKNMSQLLYMTCYFHRSPENDKDLGRQYSSYFEYLGERKTSWVKPEAVLSLKEAKNYKDLIEKYKPSQEERDSLEGQTLEPDADHHERIIPTRNPTDELASDPASKAKSDQSLVEPARLPAFARIPEIAAIAAVFMVLVVIGVRNINASAEQQQEVLSMPETTPEPEPEPVVIEEEKPKTLLTVKITDGAASVNVRQSASTRSEKIAEAQDGQTFEFVVTTSDSDWYEIKLENGTTGFISARYAYIEGEN